jgi:biopolymer transport protein ExbD
MAEVNSAGSGNGKGRSKKSSTKVDMTPMVDLAFLLITFFMLTTTFGKPQAMPVNMPDKTSKDDVAPVAASKAFTILLGEKDKVYYYSGYENPDVKITDFSAEGIRKVIIEKQREVKDVVIIIKPTKVSRYKNVVDILDEMKITSAERYAIVAVTDVDYELIKGVDKSIEN